VAGSGDDAIDLADNFQKASKHDYEAAVAIEEEVDPCQSFLRDADVTAIVFEQAAPAVSADRATAIETREKVTSAIQSPSPIDGRSFAPVIDRKSETARKTVFLAFMESQRSIRQAAWKLIRYPQVNITQLFNLRNDPNEIHNLWDLHPDKVCELSKKLVELQRVYGDTLQLTVKHPHDPAITAEDLRRRSRAR